MAIKQAEKIQPARTYTETVELTCDICKRKANDPSDGRWDGRSTYDISEVEIKSVEGSRYPEGGHKNSLVFDMCPQCFMEYLVPFMANFGAVPRKENHDW